MAKRKKSKKKNKSTFHERFPAEFGDLKSGDEVSYKRMSDGSTSIGIIKYFHVNCEKPAVTLIDLVLGNFQSSFVSDIGIEMTEKQKKSLMSKINIRSTRPSK